MLVSVLPETIAPTVSAIYSFKATPSTVIASASNVPSKSPSTASTLPTKVVAPNAPLLEL